MIKYYSLSHSINLVGVVDVKEKRNEIEKYIETQLGKIPSLFLNVSMKHFLNGYFEFDSDQEKLLNKFADTLSIDAVIIATEPTSHLSYLLRAMKKGYHVLTDKPITTRINASIDEKQAKGIWSDYVKIYKEYIKHPKLIVSCQSQRRYHAAYTAIKDCVTDCLEKTCTGITSIFIQHSDGQRRHPQEIIDQDYHGYNKGYGKCSHSGYHFFDMLGYLLKDTIGDTIDDISISSNFFRPTDFIKQVSSKSYEKVFFRDIAHIDSIKMDRFGEIDAFIDIDFKKEGCKILNARLSLIHNGFSQRSNFTANNDLYKGNGRVRHETVILHQGPFQSIHYHSYQSTQVLEGNEPLYKAGGEFHSEVYIFRNPILGLPVFERKEFSQLLSSGLAGYSRGHQEFSREKCFLEFIEAIRDRHTNTISSIDTHNYSVAFMAGAYISAAKSHSKVPTSISLDPKKVTLCLDR
ncbi:Gfo/Idh/MocA family oxidoreductase [Candidatus Gracilibacteria bacterium]|nr:Gfo/Idh/MocA family oxidoreductase [Candidatus Gracilibacteria bacterium]